jgi:2Fe-2S ferredoxin
MPRVIFFEHDGTRHEVDASNGVSLMRAAGARTEMEESMLSFAASTQDNSRLACQIEMSDALDGIVVRLPEGQH